MINYAHRGASEYAPENTMAAFYKALECRADGIETDVRRTKDGVLVLFHDKALARIVDVPGTVSDYSLNELYQMDFGIYKGLQFAHERIVTLDDFLKYFAVKDLHLAIEIKDLHISDPVLAAIKKYDCANKTIITSFELETLAAVRAVNSSQILGYLVDDISDENIQVLISHRINQICPRADHINVLKIQKALAAGLTIRAWGVKTVDLMNHVLRFPEVSGMTVNFPDILAEASRDCSLTLASCTPLVKAQCLSGKCG